MILCRYESPEIALNCGIMLRECIRHEPLAKITLYSQQFYDFFTYVEMSTFDIASDAFATFKVCSVAFGSPCCQFRVIISEHTTLSFQDLLTRHKLLSAEFLEQHYDRVSPNHFIQDACKRLKLVFSSATDFTVACWF